MCSKDKATPSQTTPPTTAAANANDAYYRQFIYKLPIDCSVGAPAFQYPASVSLSLETGAPLNIVRATVALFMTVDHTYQALYEEQDILKIIFGEITVARRQKIVSGAWTTGDDGIALENLGLGQAIFRNGVPGLVVHMQNDIMTKGLKDA